MHLGAADPAADFALGELVHEPEAQHLALDVGERSPAGGKPLAMFGQPLPVTLTSQRLAERAPILVLVRDRGVERSREIVMRGI